MMDFVNDIQNVLKVRQFLVKNIKIGKYIQTLKIELQVIKQGIVMSKKISFSSVLRDKPCFQKPVHMGLPTLSQLFQQFIYNPQGNYTLNLSAHKSKAVRKNPSQRQLSQIDFEQGLNPLQQWINSQSSQSQCNYQNQFNKQNSISNTQYERKSISKYSPLKTIKSPRRNFENQVQHGQKSPRNNFKAPSRNKNLSMNELSKMYVQNKNSRNNTNYHPQTQQDNNQPVWKFASQTSEQSITHNQYTTQYNNQYNNKNQYAGNIKNIIKPLDEQVRGRESQNTKKQIHKQIQPYKTNNLLNSQQNKYLQTYHNEKKQQYLQNAFNHHSSQNSNMRQNKKKEMIERIKSNLTAEIYEMAHRIIQEKQKQKNKSLKDQQLLISQRQSQCQNSIKRHAQQQIQEYLKMKNKNHTNNTHPISNQHQNIQQNIQNNSGVGYSFASQFNSRIASNLQSNQNYKQTENQIVQNDSNANDLLMKKSEHKAFCLPNIDEVRSEHDYNELYDKQRLSNYPQINSDNRQADNQVEIDKKFIKQIQSVAYGCAQEQRQQNKKKIQKQLQQVKPSLNEKVSKLSMSMSVSQNENVSSPIQDGNVKSSLKQPLQKSANQDPKNIADSRFCQLQRNMDKKLAFCQSYGSFNKCEQANKIQESLIQQQNNSENKQESVKSVKKDSPLVFKKSRGQQKTNNFNIYQSNKNSNSNHSKQGSGVSQHKRMLKITLSPKYQTSNDNNISVTNFEDPVKPSVEDRKQNKANESINQINKSIPSNNIKLESYFGNKKMQIVDQRKQSTEKQPMIRNTGAQSRRFDSKVSFKNSLGVEDGKKSINASANEDKFQFDLDF